MEWPRYRIRDKAFSAWLTWDLAFTREEAMRKLIAGCKSRPGRAFRLEEIPRAERPPDA